MLPFSRLGVSPQKYPARHRAAQKENAEIPEKTAYANKYSGVDWYFWLTSVKIEVSLGITKVSINIITTKK